MDLIKLILLGILGLLVIVELTLYVCYVIENGKLFSARDAVAWLKREWKMQCLIVRHFGKPAFFKLKIKGGLSKTQYIIYRNKSPKIKNLCSFCVYTCQLKNIQDSVSFHGIEYMFTVAMYISRDEHQFLQNANGKEYPSIAARNRLEELRYSVFVLANKAW